MVGGHKDFVHVEDTAGHVSLVAHRRQEDLEDVPHGEEVLDHYVLRQNTGEMGDRAREGGEILDWSMRKCLSSGSKGLIVLVSPFPHLGPLGRRGTLGGGPLSIFVEFSNFRTFRNFEMVIFAYLNLKPSAAGVATKIFGLSSEKNLSLPL